MILSIKDLNVQFKDNQVFDDLNLIVNENDYIVIRSEESQGATSLLKCCMGLLNEARGEIFFEGIDILSQKVEFDRLRKLIAYVYEYNGLINLFTVEENLTLQLRYHSMLKEDKIMQHVWQVSEDLGITSLLQKEPNELSPVSIRIVNLARALLAQPRLILIDRLGSGMLPRKKMELLAVIKEYQLKHKFGIIMTTMDEKPNYGTHVYRIVDKRLMLEEK